MTVQISEKCIVRADQKGGVNSWSKNKKQIQVQVYHLPHVQPFTWLSSLYIFSWISINYLQNKDLDSSVTEEKTSVKKKEWIRTIRRVVFELDNNKQDPVTQKSRNSS